MKIIAVLLLAMIVAGQAYAAEISPSDRLSGSTFMAPETQAMQSDGTSNPGLLWVLDGQALWDKPAGAANKSCASCHGEARSMAGIATKYPAWDDATARPVDLEQRVNLCRTRHQQASPLAYESRGLLALTALIGMQSRGQPIDVTPDPRLAPVVAQGRDIFMRRQGQLNLGCTTCHDDNWDRRLAGSAITQGHPTGYPLYRLEWQGLGSLQRRLRNCMVGMRAQPFAPDAPETIALEAYLMSRARGMPIETPAVRP